MSSPSEPASPTSQPVHIHLPNRFLSTRTHGESSRSSSISFAGPAQQMLQSRSDSKVAANAGERRRRVRSLGHDDPMASGSRAFNQPPSRHSGSRRKKPTHSENSAHSPLKLDSFVPEFEPNAFSDEYDLSHEDPKILQDVQRALHLQSRRRERMSQQPHGDLPAPTGVPANISTSHASTSAPPLTHHSPPQHLQTDNLPSEVDFSPSTRSAPSHPVPRSSNGGATLDWTTSQPEDEKLDRRWPISRGKRKAKERIPSSTVEKQESLFTDRISRIRAEASPRTVRKAAIVSEQLGRRYNILYSSLATGHSLSLARIARWHAGLGTNTQTWLASAEPLVWLKHLLHRPGIRRSQWHISALIVEEYVKFKKSTTSSTPPPWSSIASSSLEIPPSQYRSKREARHISAFSSDSAPGIFSSRIRSSDGPISFGPLVANSSDARSNSPTRGEENVRGWKSSSPSILDTVSATGVSTSHHHRNSAGGSSPASSRLNFPDIMRRFHQYPAESEEGSSSPLGSQSEDQNDFVPSGPRKKSGRITPLHSSQLQESALELQASHYIPPVDDVFHLSADPTNAPTVSSYPDQEITLPPVDDQPDTIPVPPGSLHPTRLYRSTSLTFTASPSVPSDFNDKPEDQLEREYELKSRMLEELKDHNHRLRHRMQRVASDVREYEAVCSSVMPTFGIAYRSLPLEFLDTFSHDPSAVTGGTRKRNGWRVVEDIHARVLRQREILTSFLSGTKSDSDTVPVPEDILDRPVSNLVGKLQALERERRPLQEQADDVLRELVEVRASHSTVKEEYNGALSYTSVVYPELSQIVALEESYRDQYQHVWELGMDALTLILDTIAPFWRSYGKIIGEDMQDFIIIPWYRNEFTGEPKRYPVLFVPRRSPRHWTGLFCLSALTFFVTFLQARAALTSAWHYRLVWIDNQTFRWLVMPFFWVVILIQWFALLFDLCVVLLYIAVVVWWMGWSVGILA